LLFNVAGELFIDHPFVLRQRQLEASSSLVSQDTNQFFKRSKVMCNSGLVPQQASLLAEPAEGSAPATTPKAVSEAFGKKLDDLKAASAPPFACHKFCRMAIIWLR
jgi:hypothetical protein